MPKILPLLFIHLLAHANIYLFFKFLTLRISSNKILFYFLALSNTWQYILVLAKYPILKVKFFLSQPLSIKLSNSFVCHSYFLPNFTFYVFPSLFFLSFFFGYFMLEAMHRYFYFLCAWSHLLVVANLYES
jgi:hypothetical protein